MSFNICFNASNFPQNKDSPQKLQAQPVEDLIFAFDFEAYIDF